MKKIKSSLIKTLLRTSSQPSANSILELSLYSLSLSPTLRHRVFFEHYRIGERSKERTRKQEEARINKGRVGFKWLQ